MAVYFATKAYVTSFTEALAQELSGTEITATVICPGATATKYVGLRFRLRFRFARSPARSLAVAPVERAQLCRGGRQQELVRLQERQRDDRGGGRPYVLPCLDARRAGTHTHTHHR